jgi:hypothetical protein
LRAIETTCDARPVPSRLETALSDRTFLLIAAGVAVGFATWSFVGTLVRTIFVELDGIDSDHWRELLMTGITLIAVAALAVLVLMRARRPS